MRRLSRALRDSVEPFEGDPTVVTVCDVHGHVADARSALLTLADHPDYEPVVTLDEAGWLRWAGNDYVLAFNGDLVNVGPNSAGALAMVERLRAQAPPGRVRYTLGNHETAFFFGDVYPGEWWTDRVPASTVEAFCEAILAGHVTVAFEGHRYVHTHAGHPDGVEPSEANETLVEFVREFLEYGPSPDGAVQRELLESYPALFATGEGADAGWLWLPFDRLPADAPRQLVGHTPQDRPVRRGNVICGDVLKANRERDGGEGVLLETPEGVTALTRSADGGVDRTVLERERKRKRDRR